MVSGIVQFYPAGPARRYLRRFRAIVRFLPVTKMIAMPVSIINTPFTLDLYGFSGVAVNRNWKETGFGLMNNMWAQVKSKSLKNKGLNVWVYGENDSLFAGVELESAPPDDTGLELKKVHLARYAYYKHIGPYHLMGEAHAKALHEIKQSGLNTCWPYIEIYGHWTDDESKLETEMLWCLA